MCDCLLWRCCLMLHLRRHEMRSIFWDSCSARQTEYSEISFSFKLANPHSKTMQQELWHGSSSIIPNINREKKRSAYTVIASFTTAISLSLSACLCDLSLPQPLLSIPLSWPTSASYRTSPANQEKRGLFCQQPHKSIWSYLPWTRVCKYSQP